jgi:hypothetical protein
MFFSSTTERKTNNHHESLGALYYTQKPTVAEFFTLLSQNQFFLEGLFH